MVTQCSDPFRNVSSGTSVGEGARMAVTVQMQFESAVTELYEDAFVGSSIEKGTTILQFDRRTRDVQRVLETTSTLCWRKDPYSVEMHELSTFPNPVTDRCIVAQGSSLNAQNQRVYFTPEIKGVSTSQPMSHSVIRLACSLAVVCGVSLRHMALLFSALFLLPMTQSSIKRWMDDSGAPWPTPEEMLRQRLALTPATAWHMDGDDPLGTDHGAMVVKDAHARILITPEAASEHGAEARQLLQQVKDLGLHGTAAFADYAQSFPEAIPAGWPHARFQADHFHTVKHLWGHLKKLLRSSRRQSKASGEAQQHEACLALAQQVWTGRWSLLKKPSNVSVEEKQASTARESEEEGFVHRFRSMIRQLVQIFDHAQSEAQAKLRLQQLRKAIHAMEDQHLEKMPQCLDEHWDQALRYLRKKGMGKPRRGSNAESGMRLLRRLEKNHDGLRSAATRQYYIQIYQAIKDRSLDVAEFIEQGPQIAELSCV